MELYWCEHRYQKVWSKFKIGLLYVKYLGMASSCYVLRETLFSSTPIRL
jgi:hypothetical protein